VGPAEAGKRWTGYGDSRGEGAFRQAQTRNPEPAERPLRRPPPYAPPSPNPPSPASGGGLARGAGERREGADPSLHGERGAGRGQMRSPGSQAGEHLRLHPAPQAEQGRGGVPRGNGKIAPARAGSGQIIRAPAGSEHRQQPRDYLAVHGVEKNFSRRKVVRGVSLYVRRGEAVGLLGPNGAGKTTVFYMITGLIKADRGRIHLDGHDVTALPMYQRARLGIGYLPQEASIFRGLNVEENIRAVLEMIEPSRRRREAELDSLLEEFNIVRLRKTPTIALSGGERRRVEIARALATRPNYMLLDEPFAGIDPIAVGDIQALVRHLTQRGIGVLITDHNVRETLGLTDRAYIIYSGEVLMEGEPDDIVNNPDVRRLYLGEEFRM
jgi:lipopolysaccharide export system ATP-binding protein